MCLLSRKLLTVGIPCCLLQKYEHYLQRQGPFGALEQILADITM